MSGLLLAVILVMAPGAQAEQPGISGVSRAPVDLTTPRHTPPGESWYYGIASPLQLDATTVGLLANIRRNGTPYGDFEVGTDLILFDDLNKIDAGRVVPISRTSREPHPATGEPSITSKYPAIGGFVPYGEKDAQGAPHPHAGSGFGIAQVAFYPADFSKPLPPEDQLGHEIEVQQFYYDGKQFTASRPQRLNGWPAGDDGWQITAPGVTSAIADGNDLLLAVTCAKAAAKSVSGIARFCHGPDGWQPASFVPITDPGAIWYEPSLIRDTDGSLLFTARNNHVAGKGDIPLWRSRDGGQTWERLFLLRGARTGTPLVLNQAADGTPYLATNTSLGTDRNILQILPLKPDRSGLEGPIEVRNGSAEFGPAPSGTAWKVDHGIGGGVRLADGRWHGILTYRVLDQAENVGKPATRFTGLYVEEVTSTGEPRPPVRFATGRTSKVDKRVDTVLLRSDSGPQGVSRWSEGTILNLDGKRHLMMLVTAFSQGWHDNSSAKILRFDSLDGGLTWTPTEKAHVFQDMKGLAKENVMAPSLLRLRNGDILGFFNVINSLTDGGPWVKRSTDNAKTWSRPERLPYRGYGSLANDRAIQISTGRILVPCWTSMDRLASAYAYCFYSDDAGRTWRSTARIDAPKGSTGRKTDPAAEEPMIVELKGGRLMMVLRVYLKSIYVSYSEDHGATWSPPRSSGIPAPGSMTTITRMPDGNILLIWNWAPLEKISGPLPRNFLTAAVSTDEGKNFSSVRHLDGGPDFAGKITMANVTFCDGNAVITYSRLASVQGAGYDWRLQVIPLAWFYEGDMGSVYGEKYLPRLNEELKRLKAR
jgi:sialidase-1